ncbi:MAG: CPBP family intramembrane metalloprotease, partial [Spirochaetales bacterium]|nr:CPBP family intramembrane metalloprotease [Spirochaetales bacterium]
PSPWQRFGLGRLRARDLPAGLLIFAGTAAVLVFLGLALRLLPAAGRELFEEGFRFTLNDWRLVPLAVAFGVVTGYREELFFRGYLITRFLETGAPGPAAVGASCLLFALGHLYQGLSGFLTGLAIGTLFGVLFLRGRNLHPLAIAHALYNTMVLAASLWTVSPA